MLLSIMSKLQTHYHLKLYCQKVYRHTGGKWLIHGAKHHTDNQYQIYTRVLLYNGNLSAQYNWRI